MARKGEVLEDRLMFFNVKDGWEPLCRALGKPISDVPFLRLNDGEAINRLSEQMFKKALMRWGIIMATGDFAQIPFVVLKSQ
jgi:hypothetical protein